MRKLILTSILLLFFSSNVFAGSDAGVWRWEDASKREAVTHIDYGQLRINDTTLLHEYSLVCVDGVKVYTVKFKQSISTVIIPGRCDGKLEKKEVLQKQVRRLNKQNQPVAVETNKSNLINW